MRVNCVAAAPSWLPSWPVLWCCHPLQPMMRSAAPISAWVCGPSPARGASIQHWLSFVPARRSNVTYADHMARQVAPPLPPWQSPLCPAPRKQPRMCHATSVAIQATRLTLSSSWLTASQKWDSHRHQHPHSNLWSTRSWHMTPSTWPWARHAVRWWPTDSHSHCASGTMMMRYCCWCCCCWWTRLPPAHDRARSCHSMRPQRWRSRLVYPHPAYPAWSRTHKSPAKVPQHPRKIK